MNNSIFREKSMSQINSPEKLNEYIRISTPGIWMTIVAIVLVIVGVLIWGIFTRFDLNMNDGSTKEVNPISYVIN
ncbi:MAG: hypothetical protein K5894_10925 [Lachnospiraceae bacterium]|nr:hypothetical protein [Lachnospiraceae bacterium]